VGPAAHTGRWTLFNALVARAGSSPLATTTVFRHTVVAGETSVTMTYSTNTSTYAVVVAVYSGVNPNQPIDVYATGRQRPARWSPPPR